MSRTEHACWFFALVGGIALSLGLFGAAVEAIVRADALIGCLLTVAFVLSLALMLTGLVVFYEREAAGDE